MAPYETIYERKCRSPVYWDEMRENFFPKLELVQRIGELIEKIRKRMLTAQSRHKICADVWRRKLELNVRDKVILKVAPMKGVMRFGKKGKLNPRYIGPLKSET